MPAARYGPVLEHPLAACVNCSRHSIIPMKTPLISPNIAAGASSRTRINSPTPNDAAEATRIGEDGWTEDSRDDAG